MRDRRPSRRLVRPAVGVVLVSLVWIAAGASGAVPDPGGQCVAGQEVTFTLPGGVPLVMVCVPRGAFMMGAPPGERGAEDDERPQHQVTLTQDFYLGKYEVTQAQWRA